MSQQNATLPERVVEYIGYSSAAMDKMAAALRQREDQEQKRAALIPKAVEALLSGERITADQQEKAAEILGDPTRTLELLIKVAVHRNAGERSLGAPVGDNEKRAGDGGVQVVDSLNSAYVGRRTTMTKQSDVRLFQGLGLQTPAAN